MMRISIANCVLLFLLHVLFVEAQDIQFQFEVLVDRYRNRDHRNADGTCCTGSGRGCNNLPCNNLFIFCAGPSGLASVNTGMCPYGMVNFTVANDDFRASSIVPGSQVPNPIVFRGSGSWTGQFQLNIVINNIVSSNINNLELVDTVSFVRNLSPSTQLTSRMVTGMFDQGEFELSYRVQCVTNYYGSDCNTLCVETDRFTCDQNGNIVCNEGYQNEANSCSDCVPATGCDPTNGYCNTPGECICMEGFTGPLCDSAVTSLQERATVSTILSSNSPSEGTRNENLGIESNSNQTTALNPALESEQQGGLSQGGVAGVVITVLMVVALLVGGSVAIGIVLWVYQPWSNGWFGVEDKLKKMNGRNDAISNPVYEQTEADSSGQYAGSPVRGVKYTPMNNNGGAAGNGQVNINMLTRSLDDDNPLYASSALEKILSPRDADGTRNANGILQEELMRGMGNGHAQSNSGVTASPQHNIAKIATLRESASLEHILMSADVRDLTKQSKPKSSEPPPVPMKPKIQLPTYRNSIGSLPRAHGTAQEAMTSFLMASQSLDNLLNKPKDNFLYPYGDYGDKTLQRVASANSMNEARAEGNGKTAKNDQMFDNPDYEFVNTDNGVESDQPKDTDYEEIES